MHTALGGAPVHNPLNMTTSQRAPYPAQASWNVTSGTLSRDISRVPLAAVSALEAPEIKPPFLHTVHGRSSVNSSGFVGGVLARSHALPPVAFTIAKIPARTVSGISGHAFTTRARSAGRDVVLHCAYFGRKEASGRCSEGASDSLPLEVPASSHAPDSARRCVEFVGDVFTL